MVKGEKGHLLRGKGIHCLELNKSGRISRQVSAKELPKRFRA